MLSWHMGLELGSLKTIILLWESAKKKSLLPSCQDFSLLNYFCLSQNESSITNTYIDRFWIRAKLSVNIFLRKHLAFIFGYLFPKLKLFHYLCLGGGFFCCHWVFKQNSISCKNTYQLKASKHSFFVLFCADNL